MIHINIERNSDESLKSQLLSSLKKVILAGILKPEQKLPSQRELSDYLNISRNTVMECYDQLIAEGYAYTQTGSGTFVCKHVALEQTQLHHPIIPKEPQKLKPVIRYSFRTGIPDLTKIPIKKWANIYHKTVLDLPATEFDYQDSFGDYHLREQLALYLNRVRGTFAAPEQIMITNGAAQSFSLLCRLISGLEYALVEEPLSYGILHTLEYHHIRMQSISVDSSGMVTSQLPANPPKLILTTPSHQFPTGVILPAARRIELIRYARKHHCYIVEDDYDSEFRFDGSPIQSLQYLDPEHVIYIGTFSKTLMPSLRIGYMILPPALCQYMHEAKYVSDLHSTILEQVTLSEFLKQGCFEEHIRKMRKLYLRKRNCLVQSLRDFFGERVKITGAEAGLHLIATFKDITFDDKRLDKLLSEGIQVSTVSRHCISEIKKESYSHSLVIGYGNTPLEDIRPGIQCLSDILLN